MLAIVRRTRDKVGNVLSEVTMRSNDNDTNGLDAENHDDFIQTVVHKWYDSVYRLTAVANYGTCETHDAWAYSTLTSRPTEAPSRDNSILVTSYVYDAASRLDTVTDPNGVVTKFTYDYLGRTVRTIEAYGQTEARWTLTQYDGLSNVVYSIADIGKNDTGPWADGAGSGLGTGAGGGACPSRRLSRGLAIPTRLARETVGPPRRRCSARRPAPRRSRWPSGSWPG